MTDAAPRPALRLGDKVPDFEAKTTHGMLKLSDWAQGHWVVLFSHPADFTPVCTTEFAGFARRAPDFAKRKVKLIGKVSSSGDDPSRSTVTRQPSPSGVTDSTRVLNR